MGNVSSPDARRSLQNVIKNKAIKEKQRKEKQKQLQQQTNTQEATVGYEQRKELVVFCHTQQFVERKPVRQV